MIFFSVGHYKDRMKSSKICRSDDPFSCNFCDYIELDSNGLNQHLVKNQLCAYHYEELKLTTGLLSKLGKESGMETKINTNVTSYTYPRYSADGIEDTVQLNLHDKTIEKEQSLHKDYMTRSNNSKDLTATYQKQRLLACLESHGTNIDNNDEIYSSCDDSDSDEGNIFQQLDPLLQSQYDIREEQDELGKRFSQLKLTKSNEMHWICFTY